MPYANRVTRLPLALYLVAPPQELEFGASRTALIG
jgi:hypothetical protein